MSPNPHPSPEGSLCYYYSYGFPWSLKKKKPHHSGPLLGAKLNLTIKLKGAGEMFLLGYNSGCVWLGYRGDVGSGTQSTDERSGHPLLDSPGACPVL